MGYNSKYTGAQIDALLDKINEGKTSTPRVAMTASSAELAPDTFYVWGMADSLDLTLADGDAGVMNKYLFQFRNPVDSVTMLTLPDDITWSEDTELDDNGLPVMEATAFYRIEIIEGFASLKKWKLAYIVFADEEVKGVLIAKGVGDGVGITKKRAAAVTDISNWFALNENIKTFHEFQYFTSVTSLHEAATINGGTGAFIHSSIEEITLPPSIVQIGAYAFAATPLRICNGLESVIILGDYVFRSTSLEGVINMPNLEEVGEGAFSTTSITEVADFGKVVTLPDAEYGGGKWHGVFAYCASLLKVTLPNTLQTIGSRTFIQCTALEDVYIGENVTTIGENAFNNCKKLVAVRCMAATPPTLASNSFSTTNSTFIIYVPDASVEAYKAATNWNTYASRIKGISEYTG